MNLNSTQNLVDPKWELLEPTPDIHQLFMTFNDKFFVGELACVELEWSKKMYRCAGICYSKRTRSAMSCIIRLSEPLLKLRSRKELIETLLHEMIHAWNFIRGIHEENGGHGTQFLSKMNEINRLAGTNITVYHTFHDEVELYKKHWWRCNGPCQNRKPFYGFVKRTSNRAPSKNDFWWEQHLSSCGGTFIKVRELEKKSMEKSESKKIVLKTTSIKKSTKSQKLEDIRKFFTSDSSSKDRNSLSSDSLFDKRISVITNERKNQQESQTEYKIGGSGSGQSRLLDIFNDNRDSKKRKLTHTENAMILTIPDISSPPPIVKPIRKSIINQLKDEFEDNDIIFIDDEFDDTIVMSSPPSNDNYDIESYKENFCNCPICNSKVKTILINQHLDECLTLQYLK